LIQIDKSAFSLPTMDEEGELHGQSLRYRCNRLVATAGSFDYQPGFRCIGWNTVISLKRKQVHLCLEETPSLRAVLSDSHCLQSAWDDAYVSVINELGVDAPDQPIWTAQQILNPNFLPD
jgi:hypothetical protein